VHGFLKDGETFTRFDVPFPNARDTVVFGINDEGQIVGTVTVNADEHHGFLIDGDTLTIIDVPGARFTFVHGINNAGQIVGYFRDAAGIDHGFLKDGETFTAFDLPDGRTPYAYGINDEGQIVGYFIGTTGSHGFLKDGETFTTFHVPDATHTRAYGINNAGQIVGTSEGATGLHGFVATPVDTTPPVITVSASPSTLRPPNGRLVTVMVSGAITDGATGSGVQASMYQVTDEYGQIQPSGNLTLDEGGQYGFTVALEASRNGNDRDGRQYTITVSATDHAGNSSSASATVTVPRK
jgi:probable HAF family extracellular repeat protein